MKTKLLLAVLFFYSQVYIFAQCPGGSPPAGYTCIPDANFEQALIDAAIDTNMTPDNQILNAEAQAVTFLNILNKNISDLTGIEAFTAVETLYASNNLYASADFSQNIALELLFVGSPNLTSLNITQNVALKQLNMSYTPIQSIDVTKNIALESLSVFSNDILSLDVSKNTALTSLFCGDNPLGTLNVDANILLQNLSCYNNNLNTLNVSLNTDLEVLNCKQNNLSDLILSTNTALLDLDCSQNGLTVLDLSLNSALQSIQCQGNDIVDLDLHLMTGLTKLLCNVNKLETLNVKNGNNTNVANSDFNIQSNPDLVCVDVDNVAWSDANWTFKNPGTSYSVDCSLGIEDFNISNMRLFPNPTQDRINIKLALEASYNLGSVLGQEMQKGDLVKGNNELDISSLPNGVYFLNVKTSSGSATKKIIKE
jgi:hypothetical protein